MPFAQSGPAQVWWDSTGQGTPILLINGLSSPSSAWFRLVPLLSPHHQVITFDNLGTGKTTAPSVPYTIPMLAGAAAAVAHAAEERRTHVLGISLGGLIAQQLTLEHPELVTSLTLVSTHAGAPHMSNDKASLELIAQISELPEDERTRALTKLVHAATTPAERIEEDLAVRARQPTSAEGYRNQVEGTMSWERLQDVHTISCPTLVLHGDQDRLVSVSNAQQLAQHIPSAQLTVLPDCGHQLFTDQPERGADTVLQFIRSVDGSTDEASG